MRDLQDELSRVNGECESLKEELPKEDSEEGEAEEPCELTDEEIAAKQKELASLQKKLKSLKKQIKERELSIEERTRELIGALTNEQVYELLEAKVGSASHGQLERTAAVVHRAPDQESERPRREVPGYVRQCGGAD